MSCEIDYCENIGARLLRLETEDSVTDMEICHYHETELLRWLIDKVQEPSKLSNGVFFGTVGEIKNAIDYLDALEAARHEINH